MGPLRIDVDALYRQWPIQKAPGARPGYMPTFQDRLHRWIYGSRLVPIMQRTQLKRLLRNANLDTSWLNAFAEYWFNLGGRTLWHISDFFFLRNFYRLRQPPPTVNTTASPSEHLALWQSEGFLYGLFHAVLKESFFSENECLLLLRRYKPHYRTLLEYGAGSAPITHSIIEHNCASPDCEFTIADIPTLVFHYASHKFRHCSNVHPIVLEKADQFQIVTNKKFDIIFCCQVFEHLDAPMVTAKLLVDRLAPGGVIFFDYTKSDARGLDSRQGLEERTHVLDYLETSLRVIHGRIDKDRSMGLTAAQKAG